MRQFSIKTLLVIVAVVGLVLWFTDSGYRVIYQDDSTNHGTLFVLAKRSWNSDPDRIRIKFIPRNSKTIETHFSKPIQFDADSSKLNFQSVVDSASGIWCIYDTDDQQIVILIKSTTGAGQVQTELWHPGIHIGWARVIWANYFADIKKCHDEIPYKQLPGEMYTLD